MDDFRKFATKHLGMSSMVLDDVIKSQGGYLNPYIQEKIYLFILIRRVVLFMPDWAFMTPCNLSIVMWLLFVPVWLLRWLLFCWLREQKENVRR